MQFCTNPEGLLFVFPTRALSYRDRLLNLANFLLNHYIAFKLFSNNGENFTRSLCTLLPILLGHSIPFGAAFGWNSFPRQRKRVDRISLYCGAAPLPLYKPLGFETHALAGTRDVGLERSNVLRRLSADVGSKLARYQTPLFRGHADFTKFIRVWAGHADQLSRKGIGCIAVDDRLDLELRHLGFRILDLLYGDDVHHARCLSRLAVCLYQIYGTGCGEDACRLACIPRQAIPQAPEDSLNGSILQKELCA
uniref:p0 n=1 Tax=African eggplant yellowing virus TaxID=1963256 RepID=A0A1S6PCQ6_9VIRU|nr:P0 [African eggplant yellowing virus]